MGFPLDEFVLNHIVPIGGKAGSRATGESRIENPPEFVPSVKPLTIKFVATPLVEESNGAVATEIATEVFEVTESTAAAIVALRFVITVLVAETISQGGSIGPEAANKELQKKKREMKFFIIKYYDDCQI
jgi:hypothetical protein